MSTRALERETEQPEVPLGHALASEDERSQAAASQPVDVREPDPETSFGVPLTCLASFLAVAAAGYGAGGLFHGAFPRVVGVGAAALGAGMVFLSYRTSRTALVQLATVPVAVAAGVLLVLLDEGGAGTNIPSLVTEALRTGGIAQPPVPFDPGWRFLLTASITIFAAAAAALATGINRSNLGVFLPVPIIFGSLAAQSEAGILSIVLTLVLLIGGMAVSFGVELAREGATTGGFELRRFAKGGATLALLVALVAGVSQLGFMFPEPKEQIAIPPQRPKPQPPEPDRELFTVQSDHQVPWRFGVLDVYDGRGWLTPPFDTKRLVSIADEGPIPRPAARKGSGTVKATFKISDVRGHVVPAIANPTSVIRQGLEVDYDPRTQTLRLPLKRAGRGMSYTVEAPAPPRADDLTGISEPRGAIREFLRAPAPPLEIANLLSEAPEDSFARLQFMREKLYEKIVAKGAGSPQDVPPARVVELLSGQAGTPFEITAAEALIARWAGVPARIGYGYFGGDVQDKTGRSIRPRDAATWLEAHFEGFGWVPIVGTPPRAQSSLSDAPKNQNPSVRPSENLTLLAYVPVRLKTVQLLYVIVQYWAVRTLPYLLLGGLVLWLYPGAIKALRGWRRRNFSRRRGPADRIRVAYSEFRDAAYDFNVGEPALTPLEFLFQVEEDREHDELAWLVTRALWGDLARDLKVEDAEIAENMSASLKGRLKSTQPMTTRVLAFASRNSLRNPFTDEVPNLWPAVSPAARLRAWIRLPRLRRGGMFRRTAPTAMMFLLLSLTMGACVQDVHLSSSRASALPPRLVPENLEEYTFRPEPNTEQAYLKVGRESIVGAARVFSIHRGEDVVGALQVVAFKRAVSSRQREVRAGVLEGLGGERFQLRRFGREHIYIRRLPEQQLLLWFPPRGAYYELFIAQSDLENAGEVFANVIAYQKGEAPVHVPAVNDPRRGFEY